MDLHIRCNMEGTRKDLLANLCSTNYFIQLLRILWSVFDSLLLLRRFSRVRLCADPIDGSQPGSFVPGILQARILEWVLAATASS